MYDYGGELIYYDIPVFIDGRADLYSSYNYLDYLHISMLQGDFVSLLDSYSFDYFLVDKNYPIYTYLRYDNHYELIYSNKNVRIFQTKESLSWFFFFIVISTAPFYLYFNSISYAHL